MHGISALIVEEEYLIAADIEQTIRAAGAVEIEIFQSVADLRMRPIAPARFQLAILEAKLGHPDVIAIAEELRHAGVAVVVTSADRAVSQLFAQTTGLEKPFDSDALLRACHAALGATATPAVVR